MSRRVVHITPVYPPYAGGIGVAAQMMAEGLIKRGWQVDVMTLEAVHTFISSYVHTLKPLFRIGNAAFVPQLRNLKGYDIIHLHLPFFGGAEWVDLRTKERKNERTKLIAQYHHDADARGLKGVIFKVYDKIVLPRILKRADKVIVSTMDYARHSRIAKYIDDRFVEIMFGIDTRRFAPQAPSPKPQAPSSTILFVGSLDRAHWFKGLEILLRALLLLENLEVEGKNNLPRYNTIVPNSGRLLWKCIVIGDGDLRGKYERMARELGLNVQSNSHPERSPALSQDCTLRDAQWSRDRLRVTSVERWKVRDEVEGSIAHANRHTPGIPRQARNDDSIEVHFLGSVPHDQLPNYYRDADIFIFPSVSRAEAFGLVVLEAMASGLPVIVSDLPGVRTLISNQPGNNITINHSQQCGFTFPVNDPHALAEKIRLLINNQQLRIQMGENARKKVMECYTREKMIDKVEQLYHRL